MVRETLKSTFKRFGWAGISLLVPEGWELGAYQYMKGQGYLQLEDEEAVRVEIKWLDTKRRVSLEENLKKFERMLAKSAKKMGTEFSIRRLPWHSKGEQEIYFAWEAGVKGWGLLRQCGECNRVVMVQVLGKGEEGFAKSAKRILKSVEDHSNLWAVYDMSFRVPEGWEYKSSQLKTGYFEFLFTKGASNLMVQRWGVANLVLAGSCLEEWIGRSRDKGLAKWKMQSKKHQVHGHEGVLLQGSKAFAGEIKGVVWLCEESNKIYLVTSWGKKIGELFEVVESIECCEGGDKSVFS